MFKNISQVARDHAEAVDRELTRLRGLNDRWLGQAILAQARQARRLAPELLGNPAGSNYDVNFVWNVVPELARRLGATALQPNEGRDPRLAGLEGEPLRDFVTSYLQNNGLSLIGSQLRRKSGDLAVPNVLEILGHVAIAENPAGQALSRLAPGTQNNLRRTDTSDEEARRDKERRLAARHSLRAKMGPAARVDLNPDPAVAPTGRHVEETIPFPPQLVAISGHNAAVARHRRSGLPAGDHEVHLIAAYMDANGQITAAHDPYRPRYPVGAKPGLCDMRYRLGRFANDTAGYRITPYNFRPGSEILARGEDWANPSVAILPENEVILARNEEELFLALGERPGALRPIVHLCGHDDRNPPGLLVLIATELTSEVYLGANAESLILPLERRFARECPHFDIPVEAVRHLIGPDRQDAQHRVLLADWTGIEIAFELEEGLEPA